MHPSFYAAVKPTFSSIFVREGHTTLQKRPYVYVQGTDSATGTAMQTDVQPVHLAPSNRSACPIGYKMVLDVGTDTGQP